MKFTLLLVAALFVSNAPVSAQHQVVYQHNLHMTFALDYSPCADFEVELLDANGASLGSLRYRFHYTEVGRTFGYGVREVLPKTLVPKVIVTAKLGYEWNSRYQACFLTTHTVRSTAFQTRVLRAPDSLDLTPLLITLTPDKRLVITEKN